MDKTGGKTRRLYDIPNESVLVRAAFMIAKWALLAVFVAYHLFADSSFYDFLIRREVLMKIEED